MELLLQVNLADGIFLICYGTMANDRSLHERGLSSPKEETWNPNGLG